MKKGASAFLAALFVGGCASPGAEMPTQQGVELDKYSGVWYEQARLPNWFQKACVGDVKAEYTIESDTTIGVTNTCRTADGSTKTATAEGRLASDVKPLNPAKLEVRFAPQWLSWLPMVWGDYWILKLEGDYQYSLVGTPDLKYLWVLSREQKADRQVVKSLLDYAETLGFPVSEIEGMQR
ncbi:lipocalin family protein [Kerstersia gyiorum]|uniref:lipocalin family protein n=1 Tax=Kerstersia gyiorum TaxID=206506 RepID=UPI0008398076|nr:lipocalin family protein [Kerstersia gyiorum]MCR4158774.1 lipocalin family protein [Kerstersia gyiorum]